MSLEFVLIDFFDNNELSEFLSYFHEISDLAIKFSNSEFTSLVSQGIKVIDAVIKSSCSGHCEEAMDDLNDCITSMQSLLRDIQRAEEKKNN